MNNATPSSTRTNTAPTFGEKVLAVLQVEYPGVGTLQILVSWDMIERIIDYRSSGPFALPKSEKKKTMDEWLVVIGLICWFDQDANNLSFQWNWDRCPTVQYWQASALGINTPQPTLM